MKAFTYFSLLVLFTPIALRSQTSDGPNSASAASNVGLTGSASSWINPSNSISSDNQYAIATFPTNGDYSDYLQVTDFGFNLPASSVILGIVVDVERNGDRVKDNQIRIVKGGVIGNTDRSLTSNWPNTDAYAQYGGTTDLWGETWTHTDINATNFGFAISASRVGGGQGNAIASVDHVRITIHYDTALPVGMLCIEPELQDGIVQLKWATVWEIDNSHFEVQRADYSLTFSTIGFVPGSSNTDSVTHYSFADRAPKQGRSFYRLVQHDFNGRLSITEIVAIDVDLLPAEYSLIPTLVDQSITLSLPNDSPDEHVLIFTHASGKQLRPIFPDKSETDIDQSYFEQPGLYFYRLFRKGKRVLSGKVLKP